MFPIYWNISLFPHPLASKLTITKLYFVPKIRVLEAYN